VLSCFVDELKKVACKLLTLDDLVGKFAMQEKAEPQDLRVYPARVNDEEKIFVRFVRD